MSWNYGAQYTYEAGRQEVINRLPRFRSRCPPASRRRSLAESPTGEIYRYIAQDPKDPSGNDIYTLNDLKALQDWVLEREFRTRAAHHRRLQLRRDRAALRDPSRPRPAAALRHHPGPAAGAIANSNANVGGDYVNQGQVAMTVRSVGLFGGGGRSGEQGAGHERSRSTAAVILRARGTSPHPRYPHAWSSPRSTTSRSASRTSSRAAALSRRAIWRAGRGRRPPDAPGPDRLLEGRPGTARRGSPSSIAAGRPRRARQGRVHRADAQERGHAAGARRTSKAKVAELNDPAIGPDASRRPDRALLRPHRSDRTHHRDGAREPGPRHGARDGDPADVPEQRPHAP